ncbi:hypothetical protein MRB53_025442 [Persea americana]|uniref:Uncharacterized protein n=1 Tax=Persea americana TaxID=3435 RepID=A0ACC2LFW0_PERAE|nr:hypothetical protein MRB53_025442 [Persea americana]|eukprot:TRINITY_DN27831_c2_g2_i2.p1 TRINITY_DN27831_c2_g2~~TRINITY_DN27831_c2_g2_i2.p1  ORF type:complete len:462 (-),score=119.91 TRINITY_DN27831_c2_g2_i2:232-1584(-)
MAPKDAAISEEISKPYPTSTFDSHTSESSHLLSLPSEAPDIRNWFSSYAYESPATLGVGCDFHDLVASEEEGIEGEKDKILEVTENPIDSSDDNDVVCVERPFDEFTKVSGTLTEDSEQEFHQESGDYSNLLSLPSEAPDIRNWFLSYEYESPATLASEEGIDYGKEKIVERIASSEDTNDGEDDACIKRPSEESEKEEEFISEQEHHLNKQDCHSVGITEIPPSLKSFNEHFRGQVLDKCHHIPSPDKVNFSVKDKEGFQGKLNDKGFTKDCVVSFEVDENSFRGEVKSEEKRIPKAHLQEEDFEVEDLSRHPTPKSNSSIERSYGNPPVTNGKEEKEFANNGFISTRNKTAKSNNGKSFMSKDEVSSAGKHSMASGEVSSSENAILLLHENKRKSVSDGRMVLSDRTNFYMESSTEISGKWQCPRKRKPFVGLPLKQLGLERWVHRVQ